jgi:hypothetical protein
MERRNFERQPLNRAETCSGEHLLDHVSAEVCQFVIPSVVAIPGAVPLNSEQAQMAA